MEEILNNEVLENTEIEETIETSIEEEITENETIEYVMPDEPIEELKPVEHYIGEVFEYEYPASAAIWCNNRGDCHIEVVAEEDTLKRYQIVENAKPTPEEEAQRIARLSLTGADVERAIYKAKGIDFEDIIALVTQLQPEGLDIKALKIELKANNFYRGSEYVSKVGALLGFSEEQLNLFFQYNDYKYLLASNIEEENE